MRIPSLSALLALGLLSTAVQAQDIDIRLSIKYVLGPAGERPTGVWGDPAQVDALMLELNAAMDRWGRGYHFRVSEHVDLHGQSEYYDLPSGQTHPLEDEAEANEAAFAWRTNAVNIFIVNTYKGSMGTGAASIAGSGADSGGLEQPYELIVLASGIEAKLWPHELGHHFGLYHTFQGQTEDKDLVEDTQFDPSMTCAVTGECEVGGNKSCCCATKVAQLQAQGYTALEEHYLLYNAMSYYGGSACDGLFDPPNTLETMLFTPGQLDRWSDMTREIPHLIDEVSGYTFFVGGPGVWFPFDGTSAASFGTVAAGLGAAHPAGGDVVAIRAGTYQEALTIDQPVVLRATTGPVILR